MVESFLLSSLKALFSDESLENRSKWRSLDDPSLDAYEYQALFYVLNRE
jgi:hypothetical protein